MLAGSFGYARNTRERKSEKNLQPQSRSTQQDTPAVGAKSQAIHFTSWKVLINKSWAQLRGCKRFGNVVEWRRTDMLHSKFLIHQHAGSLPHNAKEMQHHSQYLQHRCAEPCRTQKPHKAEDQGKPTGHRTTGKTSAFWATWGPVYQQYHQSPAPRESSWCYLYFLHATEPGAVLHLPRLFCKRLQILALQKPNQLGADTPPANVRMVNNK